MDEKTYTILDLAEIFGKDKQLIRRRILKLKLKSINKNTRRHSNDPLEYNNEAYLELANDFGISESNTHDTQSNTREYAEKSSKDKLIEVLERELKHCKDKIEKAEQDKENLYRLLNQQQQLSLSDKNKIEVLELELKKVPEEEIENKKSNNKILYYIFNRKK